MLRVGLLDKLMVKKRPGKSEESVLGGGIFPVERRTCANALMQEHAWCVLGSPRRTV